MTEKIIAVFDLEGTLFRRNSGFMDEIHNSQGPGVGSKVNMALFKLSMISIYILYKLHLVSEQAIRNATIKRFSTIFKNSSEKEITQRAKVYATKYIRYLRPEMNKSLKEHKGNGHITILISGMPKPYVEAIKQELGIDFAIGTELEIKGSIYTGQLSKIPYFGERREKVIREFINQLGDEVNLHQSFAYGDAIIDRYFMGMVGNPIAVYPDKKLAEYAKGHGWKVIFDNAYNGE
jgi:HAD superfamily hydrolase (TIGR01490 family)